MVIIIDEKLPPPPYVSAEAYRRPPGTPTPTATTPVTPRSGGCTDPQRVGRGSRTKPYATCKDLPSHIILLIVYSTFPSRFTSHSHPSNPSNPFTSFESQNQRIDPMELIQHRQTLYWLAMSLRLVNRSFYFACMNVLRSVYLPSYRELVRSGYSSDPFPLSVHSKNPTSITLSAHPSSVGSGSGNNAGLPPTPTSSGSNTGFGHPTRSGSLPPPPAWDEEVPLQSLQRETAVLDLFIAAKVREDVWLDETELHLEREETFKDLFDLNQVRLRLCLLSTFITLKTLMHVWVIIA